MTFSEYLGSIEQGR